MDKHNNEHYIDMTPALAIMKIKAEEKYQKQLQSELEMAHISVVMQKIKRLLEPYAVKLDGRIKFVGTLTGHKYD